MDAKNRCFPIGPIALRRTLNGLAHDTFREYPGHYFIASAFTLHVIVVVSTGCDGLLNRRTVSLSIIWLIMGTVRLAATRHDNERGIAAVSRKTHVRAPPPPPPKRSYDQQKFSVHRQRELSSRRIRFTPP